MRYALALVAFIIASPVLADDLDDAWAKCAAHQKAPAQPISGYFEPWGKICEPILYQWVNRQRASGKSDDQIWADERARVQAEMDAITQAAQNHPAQ